MAISQARLVQLEALLGQGREDLFYHWGEWQHLRMEVLRMDHQECQLCRAKGRYRGAKIVHHVKHLRDRPDLALSVWDGEERQLLSVCKTCHEQLHPECQRQRVKTAAPLTEERWD